MTDTPPDLKEPLNLARRDGYILAAVLLLVCGFAAYGLATSNSVYQPVPVYHRAGCPQHIGHRTLTNSVYTEADYQQAKLTCFYDIPQEGK